MTELQKSRNELRRLIAPRSIAVIGASEGGGAGANVIENLRTLSFSGEIYPVNPKHATVFGLRCFPSVEKIPGDVDFAAICLRAEAVIPAIQQCSRRGIDCGWAFASGFSEAGETGEALQRELATVCGQLRFRLIGPNCVGFANLTDRVAAYSAPINPQIQAGSVGAVVQSGSICLALANSSRGIGFSKIISTGNEAALDSCDFIEYLVEDPSTAVILAFIEGFRQPNRLLQVAKMARQQNKPILLLKVGRSAVAQRATLAHTSALAGSDRVQDALFRQLGIIRLDDLDELLESALLFLHARENWPKGEGVGLITVSGGEIGLVADLAEGEKLFFPALSDDARLSLEAALPPFSSISNPLDAWGVGDLSETYPRCMEVLAKEPEVDLVVVSLDVTSTLAPKQSEQYAAVARAAVQVRQSSGKNIVLFSNLSSGSDGPIRTITEKGRIPLLQGTRESLVALRRLFDHARMLRQLPFDEQQGRPPEEDLTGFFAGKHGFLSELEAKRVLRAYHILTPREVLAGNEEEALQAAFHIGWPVALKIHSAQVVHKTEAGGVELTLSNEEALRQAYRRIFANVQARLPGAAIEGVLVSEMVSGAVAEVIVGISTDPDYGPVVAFGLGGILVELLKDASLRIPPISLIMAAEMIGEIQGAPLLLGFRGKPSGDLDALSDTLVQVGRLATDWGHVVRSLDINPLLVLPDQQGVVAVDSLIELR